jgi:acetyl-CoA carboxylase biotin carboxylase subunit
MLAMGRRKKKAIHTLRRGGVAQLLDRMLSPLERGTIATAEALEKARHSMPWLSEHLKAALDPHIVKPTLIGAKDLSKEFLLHVIARLPHVDEHHLRKLLQQEDATFLQILTAGLGIDPSQQKEYTILSTKKLFRRVLVANRGEIALRIIRACRELGIETVAVYSAQEKNTLHVKFADKAYNLGSSKNYLNIKKIISIAKEMKVDAIHPGYGFLAENAQFAALCEKKRITFIGPSSKEIRVLGDKVEAKKKMVEYGVPIIEGYEEPLTGKDHAIEAAKKIGYPVIIKAAAGGGGKGMRIVRNLKSIRQAYDAAQAEAKELFGNDTLYIEKYVEDPRHIEFQVLADKYGNVIHFGERDCSIQRRHQKLIEEAPSPALTPELRAKMGAAAVSAIRAIGFEGAGTVEFLLDKLQRFYFIEMNTRIQVEHGITELVTGVDLVKEQIKLAAGARLSYKQQDIKMEGWAIECRINAEDPAHDFAPSPGTIINYLPPGGPGVKIGSNIHAGYKVLPHFDSLLALLMCHGKDREEVLSRMRRALGEYWIEGVKTTIPFHKLVLEHPQFIGGNITTNFVDRYRILERLRKKAAQKKISPEAKAMIIQAAVSEYLKRKSPPPRNTWGHASHTDILRQE